MATYVIGDIQGCYDELQHLLEKLAFNPGADQLWFTGDLVNRGPRSLDVLRFVKSLGSAAVTVLGNHDLHLLAVAYGYAPQKKEDTLAQVLAAEDRDELLDWLRQQPLLHHDSHIEVTLIHAGLAPQWDLEQAKQCASEVETVLSSKKFEKYLKRMYGNKPDLWNEDLNGKDRLRFITNCFTRLRFVDHLGKLCLKVKLKPGKQPEGFYPWFALPERRTRENRIVFGHWSTLGFYNDNNVIGLDTGCLWGGMLTAVRIDNLADTTSPTLVQVPCVQRQVPDV